MADGKIIIITAIDASGAQKGAKELADELEKISRQAEDTGEEIDKGVSGGFKDIFSASALSSLAVDALKEIVERLRMMSPLYDEFLQGNYAE